MNIIVNSRFIGVTNTSMCSNSSYVVAICRVCFGCYKNGLFLERILNAFLII